MFFRPEDRENLQEKSQTAEVISAESAAAYAPGTAAQPTGDTNLQPPSEHLPTVSFYDSSYAQPAGSDDIGYSTNTSFSTRETSPTDSSINQVDRLAEDIKLIAGDVELGLATPQQAGEEIGERFDSLYKSMPYMPDERADQASQELATIAATIRYQNQIGTLDADALYKAAADMQTDVSQRLTDYRDQIDREESPSEHGPSVYDVFEKNTIVTPDDAPNFIQPPDFTLNTDTPNFNFSEESLYTPTSFIPDTNFPSFDSWSTDNWSLNYSFDTSSMDIGSPNFASGGGQWDEYLTASYGASYGS